MTDEQQPLRLDPPEEVEEPAPLDGALIADEAAPAADDGPIVPDHGLGSAHSAAHGARRVGGTRADRNIVAFGFGMMLCAILLALVPDFAPTPTNALPDRLHGRVLTVLPAALSAPSATVTVIDGDRKGDVISATLEGPAGTTDVPAYVTGDEVVVAAEARSDGAFIYTVVDRWRLPILGWLLGGFALALIAIAGWAGLSMLTALAISLAVVVRLLIPLLLAGYDPVALAVGLGIAITALTLLLTHGLTRATGAAIAGTTGGLLVTAGLASLVSSVANFSGALGSEQVAVLGRSLGATFDLSGLLLAAVIFGGLGVLSDVAVTQAVAVEEFSRHDPALKERGLFRRAMPAGLSHLAASVNTLVLAYVGAALPVLVILALQVHRLDLVLNDEHVAVEVVRTFVGALGVLAAVPLTTAIAAIWVTRSESARRRATRRIMATQLARPGTRARLVAALGRFRPRRPDGSSAPASVAVSSEPLGRRRSPRPGAAGRLAREGVVQTELALIEPEAIPVAAKDDEPAADDAPPSAEPKTPARPTTTLPPPTPVPPTRPAVVRRPRRRGPQP